MAYPSFRSVYRAMIAALEQLGRASEAHRVMRDAIERFGDQLLIRYTGAEMRPEDYEHLLDGYRKAGVAVNPVENPVAGG